MSNVLTSNLAVHKVCADLLAKGHFPFIPTGEFALPVDLLTLTNDSKVLRLQVKYSVNGRVHCHTQRYKQKRQRYDTGSFDYYAVYLPDIDTVVYPSSTFGGICISSTVRKSDGKFWWYKDFLDFTKSAEQRSGREMGADFSHKNKPRPSARKERPSREQLEQLLREISVSQIARNYNVSDTSIKRWAREYNLVG